MNYVFLGPDFKPGYAMLSEIFKRDDVKYIGFKISAYRIVSICDTLSFFKRWVIVLLENRLEQLGLDYNEDIVFVYYNPWAEFLGKLGFVDKIRKKYKRSVHIVNLIDALIAKKMNINYLKEIFDAVYIYDESEARNLGISFFPLSYSRNHTIMPGRPETIDVSYVGLAKDRMPEIISVYEKLSHAGLVCKFYIVNAKKKERKYEKEIKYASRYLSEKEYFESYIAPSKCLLEIGNKGTNAITARVREAVIYDKKILSNNDKLKSYEYYMDEMIQIYDDPDNINVDFFRTDKKSYQYKGDFSPLYLLKEFSKQHARLYST